MRTLASVLEDAIARAAYEVVLESGQPVVYSTPRGSEAERTVLPRPDLFDMITSAVDEAQQVELAVGNSVEFEFEAGSAWTVHAEPGVDGMRVRAARDPSVDPVGVAPTFEEDLGKLEDPSLGFSAADSTRGGTLPPLVAGKRGGSVLDQNPSAPFESGTWALDDDDEEDFDFAFSAEKANRSSTSLRVEIDPNAKPAGVPSGRTTDDYIGVPADDDDEEPFDPFSSSLSSPAAGSEGVPAKTSGFADTPTAGTPTIPLKPPPAAAPPKIPTPASPPPPARPPADVAPGAVAAGAPTLRVYQADASRAATQRELQAMSSHAHQATTHREISVQSSPDADTRRELPTFGRGAAELNELVAGVGEGTLVYVTWPGFTETFAQAFQSPAIVLDERDDPREVWTRLRTMPVGAIVIVRREDPSALLGWILRRLEEGYRVFLETRARSPEGARRVLLGLDAGPRAEAWLDEQLELIVEPGEDGPLIRER
ncbi:hypothetical protein G6O69_35455 [Pseudenhygromyxa sp. WMMC2535]|uniref:hypothetical protein n=1 Tax=Pseudenhygromyxa sp. WMMC2535 TaxID=2712867 RepID=UPI0015539DEB|nr:hypothetical protein [Pseudenhygromyxa sp. WMMC2535]NVB43175.1 hypothetical protein [Pseudenhygromyxa sp. WMMC2535]